MDAKPHVMFVDDEENILKALRRLFRTEPWELAFARSGEEALDRFDREPFDVVVTDQRMPGMTGVELLRQIRDRAPACERIVLSGYADVQSIIQTVNEGAIYKFLMKPWDDAVLKGVVREAVSLSEVRRDNQRLQNLVEEQNQELMVANSSLQGTLTEDASARALVQAAPVGIVAVRDDGAVVVENPAAVQLLGGTAFRNPDDLARLPGLEVREGSRIETATWAARTFVFWEK